ncbi:MAG TPA: hypothetical protein VI197_06555 [Polyangiaceae bacterium]
MSDGYTAHALGLGIDAAARRVQVVQWAPGRRWCANSPFCTPSESGAERVPPVIRADPDRIG